METSKAKYIESLNRLSQNWDDNKDPTVLAEIILTSDSFEILDKASLLAHEHKSELLKSALFARIGDPFTKDHRSTLLYSCSAFNCSDQFEILNSIVITDSFGSAVEALDLIQNNCQDISMSSINYAIDEIEKVLQLDTSISEDRVEMLEFLGEYLVSRLPG